MTCFPEGRRATTESLLVGQAQEGVKGLRIGLGLGSGFTKRLSVASRFTTV